ncbi:MAG: GGDEF domain-containing protein [Ahrensia sp.]|nr:GGDEF domain-containing protein [Ahrensia sp.]
MDDGRFLDLLVSEHAVGGTVITLEDVTERVLSIKRLSRWLDMMGSQGWQIANTFLSLLVSNYLKVKRKNDYCALLVVDIDDFKYVNDAIGHGQGDELLRSVARILQPEFQPWNFGCRLGGDEFLVFVGGFTSEQQAVEYVERLSGLLTGIHHLRNEVIYSSCSVGFLAERALDFCLETAMLSADLALYSVKKTQKAGCRQFEDSMNTELSPSSTN